MRHNDLLLESKWWDDTPVVDVYHGTSTALLEHIKQDGLQFPVTDTVEFAMDVLEKYLPREKWTKYIQEGFKARKKRRLWKRHLHTHQF